MLPVQLLERRAVAGPDPACQLQVGASHVSCWLRRGHGEGVNGESGSLCRGSWCESARSATWQCVIPRRARSQADLPQCQQPGAKRIGQAATARTPTPDRRAAPPKTGAGSKPANRQGSASARRSKADIAHFARRARTPTLRRSDVHSALHGLRTPRFGTYPPAGLHVEPEPSTFGISRGHSNLWGARWTRLAGAEPGIRSRRSVASARYFTPYPPAPVVGDDAVVGKPGRATSR